MKEKRKYFYLDDFEHRLLVSCLVTARNEYPHKNKPLEDINELIPKNIDAPSKKTTGYRKGDRIMNRFVTDKRTGLQYELIGNLYFIAGNDEPKKYFIGIWGQRHLRYMKQYCRFAYDKLPLYIKFRKNSLIFESYTSTICC